MVGIVREASKAYRKRHKKRSRATRWNRLANVSRREVSDLPCFFVIHYFPSSTDTLTRPHRQHARHVGRIDWALLLESVRQSQPNSIHVDERAKRVCTSHRSPVNRSKPVNQPRTRSFAQCKVSLQRITWWYKSYLHACSCCSAPFFAGRSRQKRYPGNVLGRLSTGR